jgi:4-hydroxythreonine-4-phosphate dehydrogenase
MKPRILITLGDPAGIGPEIVAQAVQHPLVLACCRPVVVGDPLAFVLHRQPPPACEMLPIPGLNKKLALGRPSREAGRSAVAALQQATALVLERHAAALVTAPVSKESFHLANFPFPGHTEWLAEECRAASVGMLMVAGRLRALLVTRHLPLAKVSRHWTAGLISECAILAHAFVRNVLGKAHPRLIACGLNPHAGDGGLLGSEEKSVLVPALRELKKRGISVQGPAPADSVFRDMARGRYDLALAAYHDQGMIPLKLFAPERLVNITLGLPFIRTSPGHGTAYDIAGQRHADHRPMIEAIRLAARYAKASECADRA